MIESASESHVRRSQRERRSGLPNDYIVYLLESDFNCCERWDEFYRRE